MSGSIPTHGPTDPATGAPIVEVVSAGNEVLIGDVLDTNTNWLCTRVTSLGGLVRRTVMLRDDVDAIGAELRGCLGRRPALVFTVGGLGPTSDDRTLEGVALGPRRPAGAARRGRAHGHRQVPGVLRGRLRAVPRAQREPPQDGAAAGRGGAAGQPHRRSPRGAVPQRRHVHRLAPRRARGAQGDRGRVAGRAGRGDLRRRALRGALARGGAAGRVGHRRHPPRRRAGSTRPCTSSRAPRCWAARPSSA